MALLQQILFKNQNSEPMPPLPPSAMQRELKLLDQGLRRTRVRLEGFEKQYNMSICEFLSRFKQDDLD